MSQSTLQSLKTANPNIVILGYCDIIAMLPSYSYWSTVNANENWFLHDVNGNRIIDPSFGWYLMDINSSGWRQCYTSYINSQLNNSLFDGVFADDCWDQLSLYVGWNLLADAVTQATLTTSDISNSTLSNWHSDMIGMLKYVEGNIISGKKLVVNTYVSLDDPASDNHDYINVTDGKMDEGFVHSTEWALTDFESSWFPPMSYINDMIIDSGTGKIFFSENGGLIPNNPNSTVLAEVTQNVEYCYAATLLGMNGPNCYFSYQFWGSSDDSNGYYPIMSVNLGSPSDSYYQSQSVYMRDFTGGKVLFNPSANSYTVILGENYYLMNGTIVSSIVSGPWSGEILLSQP
jgi:hypothetical protein